MVARIRFTRLMMDSGRACLQKRSSHEAQLGNWCKSNGYKKVSQQKRLDEGGMVESANKAVITWQRPLFARWVVYWPRYGISVINSSYSSVPVHQQWRYRSLTSMTSQCFHIYSICVQYTNEIDWLFMQSFQTSAHFRVCTLNTGDAEIYLMSILIFIPWHEHRCWNVEYVPLPQQLG